MPVAPKKRQSVGAYTWPLGTRDGVLPKQRPGAFSYRIAEETNVKTAAINAKIKEIIGNVANLPVGSIADDADLRDDLALDSLSLLEIGVDVDYAFQLGIQDLETRLAQLRTLPEVVALVASLVAEKGVEQPTAAASPVIVGA
jgi:acyl carrier protein